MELVPLVYTALTIVTVLGALTIIISYISFKVRTKGQPKAKEHTEIIEAERKKAMPARITKMIRNQQKAYQEPSSQRSNSQPRRDDPPKRKSKNRRDDTQKRNDNRQYRNEPPPQRRDDLVNRRNRYDDPSQRPDERDYRNDEKRERGVPRNSPPATRKEYYEERPNEERIRIIKQLKREDTSVNDSNSRPPIIPNPNSTKEKSSSKESIKYQSLGDDVIKKYDGEDDDEFFTLDADDKK
ncbi:MAG: hypothetical protein M0P71_06615 [Melioribacteraceae bacterium]|nr:hypothetical protein [Melioribacteraceae bacterium]